MERRKRIRFIERNSVTIRPASHDTDGKKTRAHTFDISTGGARIVAKDRFEVGTVLRIRIDLARTKQSVTLDGEIKWLSFNEDTSLYEMGVEFQHLTSSKILSLIKHLYGQNWRTSSPVA
jgi:c-di-GMP-binding flagellar brake protein YcgR